MRQRNERTNRPLLRPRHEKPAITPPLVIERKWLKVLLGSRKHLGYHHHHHLWESAFPSFFFFVPSCTLPPFSSCEEKEKFSLVATNISCATMLSYIALDNQMIAVLLILVKWNNGCLFRDPILFCLFHNGNNFQGFHVYSSKIKFSLN